MEMREERQLVPVHALRKEQEMKEMPLEVLDMPISQLLEMYKSREIPRRWGLE